MALLHSRRHRRLLRYALPHWRGWVVVALTTILTSVIAVAQPWPLKLVVDHVLGHAPVPRFVRAFSSRLPGAGTQIGLLGCIAGASLVIFLINAINNALLTREWIRIGRSMVYALAADLFAAAQRRSVLFHSRTPVGELISRITGDSWCAYRIADLLVFAPAQALLTATLMLVLMLRMNVTLTCVALAVVPLMAISVLLLGKPLRAVARRRRDIEGRIQAHVHQTLLGMPAVQAFGQEDRERQRFEEHAAMAIRAHGRGVIVKSAGELATGLLPTLATAAVLWFGAHAVLAGTLAVGELLIFVAYLRGLQSSAVKLAEAFAALQETNASADRVFEILEAEPEIREAPHALNLDRVRGDIAIENVVFGYEPDRPVLRGVSLSIAAGETVAIVGGTGAGKSTLASLIPRLLDPWSGRVLVDGHDVRLLALASLRDQVALVLQEPFLFPMTIAANIAFGRADATLEQIESAARAANAHEFIVNLPQGYLTMVGERGSTLSGGERQRLSIARALLRDAPILVLDEPTSALDASTEKSLLEALQRLMAGRTTLMIAHRLSTVRHADRIVVLEHGQIAEQGTHDELLNRGGVYAALHRHQFGDGIHATAGAQR